MPQCIYYSNETGESCDQDARKEHPYCFAHALNKTFITDNLSILFIEKGFSRISGYNNKFVLIIGPACLTYIINMMSGEVDPIIEREEIIKGRIGHFLNIGPRCEKVLILQDTHCKNQQKVIFCNIIVPEHPLEMEFIPDILSNKRNKTLKLEYRE